MKTSPHRFFKIFGLQSGQTAAVVLSMFALPVLVGAGALATDVTFVSYADNGTSTTDAPHRTWAPWQSS